LIWPSSLSASASASTSASASPVSRALMPILQFVPFLSFVSAFSRLGLCPLDPARYLRHSSSRSIRLDSSLRPLVPLSPCPSRAAASLSDLCLCPRCR
jgi:hypothetical protein